MRPLIFFRRRAALFGFLLHEKPQWLPVIARSLADGANVAEALRRCETTPEALGDAWLAWGKQWFADRKPEQGVHFPVPVEWKAEAAGK